MAYKKTPTTPPSEVAENIDLTGKSNIEVPSILQNDILFKDQTNEVYSEVMSTLVDTIYGDAYRNFEIALWEIGMDAHYQQTFQVYVYCMLMNRNFFSYPGAMGNEGLALAITQASEHFFKDTDLFGKFILALDMWYQELLDEDELTEYKPVVNCDQLSSLVTRILNRLHP